MQRLAQLRQAAVKDALKELLDTPVQALAPLLSHPHLASDAPDLDAAPGGATPPPVPPNGSAIAAPAAEPPMQ